MSPPASPERPPALLERLARGCARHPWWVIAVWVAIVVAAVALISLLLSDVLTTEQGFAGEPESARADRLIEEQLRGPAHIQETIIVRSDELTVDDPAFQQQVDQLLKRVQGLGDTVVEEVFTYRQVPVPGLVSEDRHATVIPLTMAGTFDDADRNIDQVLAVVDEANQAPQTEVLITGGASIGKDFQAIAERDLLTGELIGGGVALAILLLVFGTVVAALLPMGLSLIAITVAVGLAAVAGLFFDLAFFVTNMITMMGLALGIDYSLFIVSRFREEREAGRTVEDAIGRTGTTAARAVLFSGLTVMLALLGLFLVPITTFRSLSIGALLVALVAVTGALTLLPALFRLLGDRVDSLKVPFLDRRGIGSGREGGFWDKVTRGVMRRPVVSIVLAVGLLLAAATSYLDINIGSAGVSTLPDRAETKQAFELLQEEFSLGLVSPLEVAVVGPVRSAQLQASMEELTRLIGQDKSFSPVTSPLEVSEAGDLALLSFPLEEDPSATAAIDAVKRVRDVYVPQAFGGTGAEVLVTGLTAQNVDFSTLIERFTPWVFAFVLGLSFVLLTVVFRSIVVPAKAIVMNLLSVGAAYGLIVLVFQKGFLREVLGFQRIDVVETWIPLFLFAVLFGLSMDYQVFLLARIREHYDQGADNTSSVAFGLRNTAGIITGAAAIMMAVFAGFAAGDLVMFQQLGFGLAVAIFLDATVIRVVLVPAAMKLLGDYNWYLPRWLHWLPDVRVEPGAERTAAAHPSETVP